MTDRTLPAPARRLIPVLLHAARHDRDTYLTGGLIDLQGSDFKNVEAENDREPLRSCHGQCHVGKRKLFLN